MKVEYSDTFRQQFYAHFHYLSRHIGTDASQSLLDTFIEKFENKILLYPESTPRCEEALELGLTTYHDYINPELQLRVIYRISPQESVIYALLFLNTRQSIQQALIRHCLQQI